MARSIRLENQAYAGGFCEWPQCKRKAVTWMTRGTELLMHGLCAEHAEHCRSLQQSEWKRIEWQPSKFERLQGMIARIEYRDNQGRIMNRHEAKLAGRV